MTLIRDVQEKQQMLAKYRTVRQTGTKDPVSPPPTVEELNTGLQGIIGAQALPEPATISSPSVLPQAMPAATQYATPSVPAMQVLDPNFSGQTLRERSEFRLRQIRVPTAPDQNAATQLTLNDVFRALPNRTLNSLQNPYEGTDYNPYQGRFGDHGGGILGGLSYVLSLPQTFTSGIAADQARSFGANAAGNRAAEAMLDRINSGRTEEEYGNLRSIFNPFSWFQDQRLSQRERDQIEMARARARSQFYSDTDNALGVSYLGAGLLGLDLGATVLQEEDSFRPFARIRQEDIGRSTATRTESNPFIREIVRGLSSISVASPQENAAAANSVAAHLSNSLDRPGLYGRIVGSLVQDTVLDPFGPLTDIAAAWRVGRTVRNTADEIITREAVRTVPEQAPTSAIVHVPTTRSIPLPTAEQVAAGAMPPSSTVLPRDVLQNTEIRRLYEEFRNTLPGVTPGSELARTPTDIGWMLEDPWLDDFVVTPDLEIVPPTNGADFFSASPVAGYLPATVRLEWRRLMPDIEDFYRPSLQDNILRQLSWSVQAPDPWALIDDVPRVVTPTRLPELPGTTVNVPLLPGNDAFLVPQEVADVVRLGDLYGDTYRGVLDNFTARVSSYPEPPRTQLFSDTTGEFAVNYGSISLQENSKGFANSVVNTWDEFLQTSRSRQYFYTEGDLNPRHRILAEFLGFDADSNRPMQVFDNRPDILREMYPMNTTSARGLFEVTLMDVQDGLLSLEQLYDAFMRSENVNVQGFYASIINQVVRNSENVPEPLMQIVRAIDAAPANPQPPIVRNRNTINRGVTQTPVSDTPLQDVPNFTIVQRMADADMSPSTDILLSENGLSPEIIDALPRVPRAVDEYETIIVETTGAPIVQDYRGREWLQMWSTLEAADQPGLVAGMRGAVDPDRLPTPPARAADITDLTPPRPRNFRAEDLQNFTPGRRVPTVDDVAVFSRYVRGEISSAQFLDAIRLTDSPVIRQARRANDAMSIAADLEVVTRNTDEIIQQRLVEPTPRPIDPNAPLLQGTRSNVPSTEVTTDPAMAAAQAIARSNPNPRTTSTRTPRRTPKPKDGGVPIVQEVSVVDTVRALGENDPLEVVTKFWADQVYEFYELAPDVTRSVIDEERLVNMINTPMRNTGAYPSLRQMQTRLRSYLSRVLPNDKPLRTEILEDLNERLLDVISREYSAVQRPRSQNVLRPGAITVVGDPMPLPEVSPEQIAAATAITAADEETAELAARQMQGQLRRMNTQNAQTARNRARVEVQNFNRELEVAEAAAEPRIVERTTTPTSDRYRPPADDTITTEYVTITDRLREKGRTAAGVVENVEGHILTGDWYAMQNSITRQIDSLLARPRYTAATQEYEQDLRRLYELARTRITEGYRAIGEVVDIPGLPC